MKNLINLIKEKKWIQYILILLIGFGISVPLLWIQIRTTDDGWLHLIRLIALNQSIDESNFPFLVSPYLCRNFGYSMTALYPPIVVYIPYILSFIGSSFVGGLKLFAALTIGLSGIFMYNFIHEVTKNKGISFLSAVIYIIFPYRLEVIFNRFAIGEFTAFVFIPIVFQGLYNLLNGDGKKHFYIAIGAIGLILSHTISTVYTAVFCIIYILFNLKAFLKKDVIIKCIINVIFILLVATFFLVPMLEFESQAHYSIFEPTVMKTRGEYTINRTIEMWQFLKDKGEENGVSFIVGVPVIFMLASTILVWKDIDKKHKDFYITYLILGILSVFMCTKFFPWQYLPDVLNTIQYPWRMIGFALFFFTPICAINMYNLVGWAKQKQWLRDTLYLIVLLILGVFTISRLGIYQIPTEKIDEKYESGLKENLIISHFSINRDYLPYKALIKQYTYVLYREDTVYVLEGACIIENEYKQALELTFDFSNASNNVALELPYFFYPGFTVILENKDGSSLYVDTFESDNGFLTIKIPENIESGKIKVTYTGTNLEKISCGVSAISLIGFIIYIIWYRKKNPIQNMRTGEENENQI